MEHKEYKEVSRINFMATKGQLEALAKARARKRQLKKLREMREIRKKKARKALNRLIR
jgi:hypothetical protein